MLWGLMWNQKNKLEGRTNFIIRDKNCLPRLFRSRKEARDFANEEFEYIKTRKDLRSEPHGWRMPRPVKVKISILS